MVLSNIEALIFLINSFQIMVCQIESLIVHQIVLVKISQSI